MPGAATRGPIAGTQSGPSAEGRFGREGARERVRDGRQAVPNRAYFVTTTGRADRRVQAFCLPDKTLAQAEFTSAEHVKWTGFPQKRSFCGTGLAEFLRPQPQE